MNESMKQKVKKEFLTFDVVMSQGKPTITFRLDDEFRRRADILHEQAQEVDTLVRISRQVNKVPRPTENE